MRLMMMFILMSFVSAEDGQIQEWFKTKTVIVTRVSQCNDGKTYTLNMQNVHSHQIRRRSFVYDGTAVIVEPIQGPLFGTYHFEGVGVDLKFMTQMRTSHGFWMIKQIMTNSSSTLWCIEMDLLAIPRRSQH